MIHRIIDQLPHQSRGDYLSLFIQCQILDVNQFFQNLCPRGAGPDPTSLNLCPEFLVLDELSGVFHGKNHGSGVIPLWRRRLPLPNLKVLRQNQIALFQLLKPIKKLRVGNALLFFVCFSLFRTGNPRYLVKTFLRQNLKIGEEMFSSHFQLKHHFLVNRRRIKNGKKPPHNQVVHLPCCTGYCLQG